MLVISWTGKAPMDARYDDSGMTDSERELVALGVQKASEIVEHTSHDGHHTVNLHVVGMGDTLEAGDHLSVNVSLVPTPDAPIDEA